MLELRRLLVLHELDRLGTLAAVARALSYSPSAVSQQLAQLEREVGTALTEPVGRGVRLTDAAAVLVTHTRAAIAELERAEAEIASSGRVSGTLRIGAFQTVLLSILPEVLGELQRRHPELRVDVAQLEADESLPGLLAGTFDVVLGEEYPGDRPLPGARLHREELGGDELLIAVPPSGPWSAVKGLADLAEARWALDPERTAPGRWARDACRRLGFEPDVRFDGTDLLAHVHLVRSGMAVAVLPGLLGAEYTRGIRLVELRGKPTRRLFTLARTSRAGHPAVIEFRDVLRQEFAGFG
jgi:DNA-binding transcriptional LysR family regulator